VVARLADPTRNTTDSRRVRWLASGIATCGVCGGKSGVHKNRSGLRYACRDGGCVARRVGDVDDYLRRLVIERLSRPDAVDLLAPDDDLDGNAQARAEVAELRERLDSFITAAAEGSITPQALAKIESTIGPKIEAATRRLSNAVQTPRLAELISSSDVEATWDALDVLDRREVLRAITTVRLMPVGQGRRYFDPTSVRVRFAGEADDAAALAESH
jgi:hypothetical protein